MLHFFKGRRRPSNFIGTFLTFANLIFFFSFIPLWFTGNKTLSYYILLSSLVVNYLVTGCLVLDMILSPSREPHFISFCLFIFFLFPYIGIFFYFLLGFDLLHKGNGNEYLDFYSRYKRYESIRGIREGPLPDNHQSFVYNSINHGVMTYRNAAVEVLDNAYATLKEITNMIREAKKYIHMEFYMFGDGFVFEHIFSLLREKREQGVEVRLLVDYAGNFRRLSRKSLKRLREIGVEVRFFNPFMRSNHLWWQFRNHNKVLIVDNKYALFGSCNIADEYFGITRKYFQTTELSAKLSGPIVSTVNVFFLTHWDLSNSEKKRYHPEFTDEQLRGFFRVPSVGESEDENCSQFLDHSPIGGGFVIRDNLTQLIFGARKSIVISSPYFFPPQEIVNALKMAKSLGLSVKILVPKTPDLINFFSTLNRQNFYELVWHGLEVYEYFGFNHEKLLIIDNEIVYFGSYNWDYRSLYMNFENALLIRSKSVANTMTRFMDRQFNNSHMITLSDLAATKKWRFFVLFIRLFKPFL